MISEAQSVNLLLLYQPEATQHREPRIIAFELVVQIPAGTRCAYVRGGGRFVVRRTTS